MAESSSRTASEQQAVRRAAGLAGAGGANHSRRRRTSLICGGEVQRRSGAAAAAAGQEGVRAADGQDRAGRVQNERRLSHSGPARGGLPVLAFDLRRQTGTGGRGLIPRVPEPECASPARLLLSPSCVPLTPSFPFNVNENAFHSIRCVLRAAGPSPGTYTQRYLVPIPPWAPEQGPFCWCRSAHWTALNQT